MIDQEVLALLRAFESAEFMLLFGCLLCMAIASVIAIFLIIDVDEIYQPAVKYSGDWIAECWVEWETCRGSTMYRQRFKYKWQARLFAKFYVFLLDLYLPTHYTADYSDGAKYQEEYNYGICWGIRKIVNSCEYDGYPIWTTHLPGCEKYSGEHFSAHPVYAARTLYGGRK